MTDIFLYENKIYANKEKTKILRNSITDWLYEFGPTHFISIQFPTNQRSYNLEKSIYRLKNIMKSFEKSLSPRHWNRKHLQFIGFAENPSGMWHFHIFLKNDRYTEEKIMYGIQNTIKKHVLSDTVINIQPITDRPEKSYYYGNKELTADFVGKFDSFRIILSSDMFDI